MCDHESVTICVGACVHPGWWEWASESTQGQKEGGADRGGEGGRRSVIEGRGSQGWGT